jgi:hypothetical protein
VQVRNLGNTLLRIAQVTVEGDFPNRVDCAGDIIRIGRALAVAAYLLRGRQDSRVVDGGEGR